MEDLMKLDDGAVDFRELLRDLTERLDDAFGAQATFAKVYKINGGYAADASTKVRYPRLEAARDKARSALSTREG